MSLTKLPSGRWRARVWHRGKDVPVAPVLGLPKGTTWRTKAEAKAAREKARAILKGNAHGETTVREWWERWTADPLFARPKESTNVHNRERTKAFAARYGSVPLHQVGNFIVAEWLAGGQRNSTVQALGAMFNDAMSAKAGRLIDQNPFARLGLHKTKGNKDRQPPAQEQMQAMIITAREITPPSFAAYLEFGCLSGARVGELDALRWECVRFDDGDVDIREQWNVKVRKFTEPKYGPYTIALVGRARELLLGMPRDHNESPFVFVTNRGHHYTPSSRTHHWNRVRCAAGLPDMTLYLATRHYFGWYALNVLELEPHVIAEQLGHRDGGRLVVQLYGHPDKARARRRIREAFDGAGTVRPLRVVKGEGA